MITYSFGHLISHEVSMIILLRISKAKYSSSKECSASYSELATSSSSSLICNHQLHYRHHLNKLFNTNINFLINFKTTSLGRSGLNMMDII